MMSLVPLLRQLEQMALQGDSAASKATHEAIDEEFIRITVGAKPLRREHAVYEKTYSIGMTTPIVALIYRTRLEKEGYQLGSRAGCQTSFFASRYYRPDAVLVQNR